MRPEQYRVSREREEGLEDALALTLALWMLQLEVQFRPAQRAVWKLPSASCCRVFRRGAFHELRRMNYYIFDTQHSRDPFINTFLE